MLTSGHIRKGIRGYLDEHLLRIVSASGGYEFITENPIFAKTYHFQMEQSPYTGRVYYVLPAPKNTGISAYFKRLVVKYRGHTFIIDGGRTRSITIWSHQLGKQCKPWEISLDMDMTLGIKLKSVK